MSATEAIPSPPSGERARERGEEDRPASRVYRRSIGVGWWTRKGHYFWYIVREFTALPLAIWLLLLLGEIKRAGDGAGTYHPHGSTLFVVFSVIALLFALYHSITFLSLAGVIIHMNIIDRPLPPWPIVWLMFGAWAVASVVIFYFLVALGR